MLICTFVRFDLTSAQIVHTISLMKVVWDVIKQRTNLRKYGVEFADAAIALEDDQALTVSFIENGEYRFKALAMAPETGVLLVIFAEEGAVGQTDNDSADTIAIISARPASRGERRQYFRSQING